MSANSVKIRIFWSASAFDLSSRMSFWSFVVVLRLELPGIRPGTALSGLGRGRSPTSSPRRRTRPGRGVRPRRSSPGGQCLRLPAPHLPRPRARAGGGRRGPRHRRSAPSTSRGASSRRRSRCELQGRRAAFGSRRSQESSKAATELSKRLRKLVRISPTTCLWRFSSNGSMSLSGPLYQCRG